MVKGGVGWCETGRLGTKKRGWLGGAVVVCGKMSAACAVCGQSCPGNTGGYGHAGHRQCGKGGVGRWDSRGQAGEGKN